jgi:trans-aconitate methyltransferase
MAGSVPACSLMGGAAPESLWNPARYERDFAFVWQYGADLIALLAPQAGERILDLGCGTGQLSTQIAKSGASVTGIDRSAEMIERARAHCPELCFEVIDASQFRSAEPFDAVFSNAALHWMKNAGEVASAIALALRRGGRLVAELGGKGNVESLIRECEAAWTETVGATRGQELNPWYFPSVSEYAGLLEERGLEVRYAALFDRPTPLEGGAEALRGWMSMFLPGPLQAISTERRNSFLSRLEERLRPQRFLDGRWVLDYRRLRVVAVKTA